MQDRKTGGTGLVLRTGVIKFHKRACRPEDWTINHAIYSVDCYRLQHNVIPIRLIKGMLVVSNHHHWTSCLHRL